MEKDRITQRKYITNLRTSTDTSGDANVNRELDNEEYHTLPLKAPKQPSTISGNPTLRLGGFLITSVESFKSLRTFSRTDLKEFTELSTGSTDVLASHGEFSSTSRSIDPFQMFEMLSTRSGVSLIGSVRPSRKSRKCLPKRKGFHQHQDLNYPSFKKLSNKDFGENYLEYEESSYKEFTKVLAINRKSSHKDVIENCESCGGLSHQRFTKGSLKVHQRFTKDNLSYRKLPDKKFIKNNPNYRQPPTRTEQPFQNYDPLFMFSGVTYMDQSKPFPPLRPSETLLLPSFQYQPIDKKGPYFKIILTALEKLVRHPAYTENVKTPPLQLLPHTHGNIISNGHSLKSNNMKKLYEDVSSSLSTTCKFFEDRFTSKQQ